VNARLVRAGVEISELRIVEQSLEEVFLELTGEHAEPEETEEPENAGDTSQEKEGV
jgi:hypothetical protein